MESERVKLHRLASDNYGKIMAKCQQLYKSGKEYLEKNRRREWVHVGQEDAYLGVVNYHPVPFSITAVATVRHRSTHVIQTISCIHQFWPLPFSPTYQQQNYLNTLKFTKITSLLKFQYLKIQKSIFLNYLQLISIFLIFFFYFP